MSSLQQTVCPIPQEARGPKTPKWASRNQWIPVTALTDDVDQVGYPAELLHRIILGTLAALREGRYSLCDGHTMTGCCHGVALLARDLISASEAFDLDLLDSEGHKHLDWLKTGRPSVAWSLPAEILQLAVLHALTHVRVPCESKGHRTLPLRLREFGKLPRKRVYELVDTWQRQVNNLVADRYQEILPELASVAVTGISGTAWGRYTGPGYVQVDVRGRKHVSSLYSMQVCLASLVQGRALVAFISELVGSGKRVVRIARGDGTEGFQTTHPERPDEPVFVIAGVADHASERFVAEELDRWSGQLDSLVLAHHLEYPEFPSLRHEGIDDSRLQPEERDLRAVLGQHMSIKGVTPSDPSLFCITHVYPASVGEVVGGKLPGAVVTEFIGKGS